MPPFFRRFPGCLAAAPILLLNLASAGADSLPPLDDLVGSWADEPVVNDQTGSVVLRFLADTDGGLTAELSLPPIEAWNIPVGKVQVLSDGLQIGSMRLEYDDETRSLNGTLSKALVPVYAIPVQLKRMTNPPRPGAPADYGVKHDPAWTFDTGAPVWSSPVVANGTLYVGSDDGKLYALAAATGRVRWSFETGGPIRSRPALDGKRILFQSDDGNLYCLNAANGQEIWQNRLADGPAPRTRLDAADSRYDHYAASVSMSDDSIYTATLGGDVVALHRDSGAKRWRFTAGDGIQGTPVLAKSTLIFGSFDNFVYALDAANGELLWKQDTGAPVVSTPAVAGGLVIVGSRSYDLFGLDAATGERRWRDYYWFSWVDSSATVVDGIAYIGSSDAGYLLALDADTGRRLWVFDTAGSAWGTPAVDADTVYIGSVGVTNYIADHKPGFFAVERKTGAPRWAYLPGSDETAAVSGFASSPATDGERVYVGGLDGRVYAFARRR